MEDKYIGLLLALSGSCAIGSSFIITKKGLQSATPRGDGYGSSSESLAYLSNPIWWAGMAALIVGEVANFAAYTFAPPILVTPLGAFSVLIGAVLASFLLGEELGHLGRIGCALCLLGSLIIVLHAPEDKELTTVDQYLDYATQPGFLLYTFLVVVVSLVMIYIVGPRHGRTNPIVYLSVCSLVGSVSVMAIKGFGLAVKLTFAGVNQFTLVSTYVLIIVVAGSIVIQMNYFNRALDLFSTNVVNPIYYVGFSSCTIVASLIFFKGFNNTDFTGTTSLITGFTVTFLGVHLLNLSRETDPPLPNGHSALEGGLMNPRLSLQGRMSIDGWNGISPTGESRPGGHHRTNSSSLYRSQNTMLFDAFDEREEENNRDGVALAHIRPSEDHNDDDVDDDDADERTRLRSPVQKNANGHVSKGSRTGVSRT